MEGLLDDVTAVAIKRYIAHRLTQKVVEEQQARPHLVQRTYPLRSTMAALEQRLDPGRFRRVHRSFAVNLDFVAEIEPLDTGDARIRMASGAVVPCSRRFRANLAV